jgi:tetratricopeptide (TPR) repeat protein
MTCKALIICFALLLLCRRSVAQGDKFAGEWYIAFIGEGKHDASLSCRVNIVKEQQSYRITTPRKDCSDFLPAEGTYKAGEGELVNGAIRISKTQKSLHYTVKGHVVELRPLGHDSVVTSYIHLGALWIEKADTFPNKRIEYLKKSLGYSRKGLAIDPNCIECYCNSAIAWIRLENVDSTVAYIARVQGIDQHNYMIRKLRTAISSYYVTNGWDKYGKTGKYPQAVTEYRKALIFDSLNVDAWYNIGGAYYTNKQYKEAIPAFRQALKLDPKMDDAKKGVEAAEDKLNGN